MGKKKGKNLGAHLDADEEPEGDAAANADAEDVVDATPAAGSKAAAAGAAPMDVSDGTSASTADAPADPDAPTLSDTIVAAGTSETRHIPHVPYCPICSMPFEYAEFSPLYEKSKANFSETYKEYYPDVEGDEELASLMTKLGFEGSDDHAKKARGKPKPEAASAEGGASGEGAPPPPQSKKEKKKQQETEIVIELNNRNKKKHITIVTGLEHFDVDTQSAAKLFGKKFACGSALKKGEAGKPDQIEIQGSCVAALPAFIVDKLKMSMDNISVVIDKKKMKASEAPSS